MFLNVLFILSALFTISCALGVVILRSLMHSCMALLGCFIGVAGLYVTLGADFIAVVQFMVYVGGVVILMLFAIMLTGRGNSQSKSEKIKGIITPLMGSKRTVVIGVGVAVVFLLSTIKILWTMMALGGQASEVKNIGKNSFGSTVDEVGSLLLTDHVLAFEFASVLLLGALIGAAIIARPKAGVERELGE